MAVAETAISSSKSPSGTSKANRRSSKCSKTTKAGQFSLSNVPPSQSIRVQAAPDLIVFLSRADSQINLLAAKNESSQTSTNSSSSGSVGVSYGIFTGSVSVNASASKGKGSSNAQDTSYSNTSITAGNTAAITSGGDTALRGAVVAANQIKADIGGSLSIESLQDKSTFASSQKSGGASISVPITAGGSAGASVSASKSNVDSNFQSVGQQSGLKAGDGGFQVSVNNNTDLKGGVISSTQQAINNNKNSLSTGGALSITDIQNTASFSGKAVGASLGAGTQPAGGTGLSGVGVGLGSTGGNAASTSSAGISGIAGNTAVRTGDAETGLQQIFDADKVQKDINAQVAITQAFSREAPKAAATFLDNQIKDLQDQLGDQSISPARRAQLEQGIKDRSEGGIIRIAVHTLMGAMGGGVSGALGAAASASAAPLMNQLQDGITVALKDAGLGDTAAKGIASGITGLTAAGLGAAVGGTQGAATGFTVDVNNRQLHPTEIQWIKANANRYALQKGISVADAEKQLAEQAFRQVQFGVEGQTDTSAQAFLKSAGNQLLPGDANIPGQTVGYLFKADPIQKANPWMYADTLATNADFYIKNGIRLPSADAIATAAMTDGQTRQFLGNLTKGAVALSSLAAIAGISPTLLTWVLTNPDKAVQTGIITVETAAGIASGAFVPGSLPAGASLTTVEARSWYLAAEAKMLAQIEKTAPLEVQAYQMWGLRNYYRTEARQAMADTNMAADLWRTDPNRTWEAVVKKTYEQGYRGDALWQEIIASSQRSRTSVNDALGLGKTGSN